MMPSASLLLLLLEVMEEAEVKRVDCVGVYKSKNKNDHK
jgi:hypothetical protein